MEIKRNELRDQINGIQTEKDLQA